MDTFESKIPDELFDLDDVKPKTRDINNILILKVCLTD